MDFFHILNLPIEQVSFGKSVKHQKFVNHFWADKFCFKIANFAANEQFLVIFLYQMVVQKTDGRKIAVTSPADIIPTEKKRFQKSINAK